MPLVGTSASITAKGYGFGLVSSVNDSVSVSGVSATSSVGVARGFAPKPTPANQYWTTLSSATSGTDVIISANLFRFISTPSPSLQLIQEGTSVITLATNANRTPFMRTTTSGRVYTSYVYYAPSSRGTTIRMYDISGGTIGTINTAVQFSYSTSGSVRFQEIRSLSVRPSGTRLSYNWSYLNSSSLTRYAVSVANIAANGITTTDVSAINPLSVDTYDQRVTALNPVHEEYIAIGGNLLSNTSTGYVWLYKNWGVSLQEQVSSYSVTNAQIYLEWSHSGEYLVSSNGSTAVVFKLNTSTGQLSQVASFSAGLSGIPLWTVDDESILFPSGTTMTAAQRNGDTFTTSSITASTSFGFSPVLNFNGGYLYRSGSSSNNIQVYEYEGPNVNATPVISTTNGTFAYLVNGSYPMFDGEG